MSTVMYSFRAADRATLDRQIAAARKIAADNPAVGCGESIEFQVFETSAGLVFRVLEAGYGLRNRMWDQPDLFPTCNYDDRSDMPDTDLPNAAISAEVDGLIDAGEYEIIQIKQEADHAAR